MNWEVIATIAEVVGAIAVVISLVYLAMQVRSNTRALQASASFETTHSWATFNETMVASIVSEASFQSGEESRLAMAAAKFYGKDTKAEELTDSERMLMSLAHRALFQKLEGQYFHYKHGYLDPQIWTTRSAWARACLDRPVIHSWWQEELNDSIYSPDFVAAIENTPRTAAAAKLAGMQDER